MGRKEERYDAEVISSEINKGNYENALQIIKTETERGIMIQGTDQFCGELFGCAATVLGSVVSSQYAAATEIFTKAIMAELQKQSKELESMDKAYEGFMNQASLIISKLDFSNEKALEGALKILESIKEVYNTKIEKTRGTSILDKIGGLFRR